MCELTKLAHSIIIGLKTFMRNACGINRTKIISILTQENKKKLLKCTSYAQNLTIP